jgi:DNA-binding NarL/FixJ family response regulator
MSAANAHLVEVAEPLPAAVSVAGVPGSALLRVARLLAEGGFAVNRDAAPATALVVVLPHAPVTEYVRMLKTLARAHPEVRILAVVTGDVPNAVLRRVLIAGASGIVTEEHVRHALLPALRAMLAGQLTVPSTLATQIAPRPLSHREKQILALVVRGMTNREIAHTLFVAESTVKTHLASAFRKLDARSRSEAVARIQDPETGYGAAILGLAEDAAAAPQIATA